MNRTRPRLLAALAAGGLVGLTAGTIQVAYAGDAAAHPGMEAADFIVENG